MYIKCVCVSSFVLPIIKFQMSFILFLHDE